MGVLLGGLLYGDPEGYVEEGGPTGEFSRGLVYRALRRLWRHGTFLHKGPVEYLGGPFTRNSERLLKGATGIGASLSMGAQ